MLTLGLAVAVFLLAAIGTAALRRYALASQLLDVPNARSSHKVPTPRGGGAAIAGAFLIGLVVLWATGSIGWRVLLAVAGPGVMVALVGFVDDRRGVRPLNRLLVHTAAASGILVGLGGAPELGMARFSAIAVMLGAVVTALALVWLLNLYNFMDGIDGIAGVEAVTVCAAATAIAVAQGDGAGVWGMAALLAAACLGFLVWNMPPARIFMGDVGSGFIGIVLGALALYMAGGDVRWLWGWSILLGVFVTDATVTLARRIARREPVHVAHRTHAYQHAARRWQSHRPVTLAVGIINCVWLAPIAWLVLTGALSVSLGTAVAYVPLIITAIVIGSGRPEAPRPDPAGTLPTASEARHHDEHGAHA